MGRARDRVLIDAEPRGKEAQLVVTGSTKAFRRERGAGLHHHQALALRGSEVPGWIRQVGKLGLGADQRHAIAQRRTPVGQHLSSNQGTEASGDRLKLEA